MLINVVVEEKTDAEILETLFNDLFKKKLLKIYIAGGKKVVHSIAITLLAKNGRPIIVVVNADTQNELDIKEKKAILEFLINRASAWQENKIIVMVPALEKIFFENPTLLENIMGRSLKPEEKVAGKYAPKSVISELMKERKIKSMVKLIRYRIRKRYKLLRTVKEMKEIRDFVEKF
jgi:hypothetical protein